MHAYAAPRERQGDAPGADAELERRAVSGELGQQLDDRVDGRRLEHVGGELVVPLRIALAPAVFGHGRTLSRTVGGAAGSGLACSAPR